MTTSQMILTALLATVSALVGAFLARYLPTKKAEAEANQIIHDTSSKDLVISSDMLEKWIKLASEAEEKVAQLREGKANEAITRQEKESLLVQVEDKLKRCTESLEKCKETHGCAG